MHSSTEGQTVHMTLTNIEEYSLRLNTIMDCTTNLQLHYVTLQKSALNKERYLQCVMQLLKVPKSVLGCPAKRLGY